MYFWGIFFQLQLNNCFGKIQVVLTRTYDSRVVLKMIFYNSGPEKNKL